MFNPFDDPGGGMQSGMQALGTVLQLVAKGFVFVRRHPGWFLIGMLAIGIFPSLAASTALPTLIIGIICLFGGAYLRLVHDL